MIALYNFLCMPAATHLFGLSRALFDFISEHERRDRVTGLLWLLAKYTCRAQNPKCYECPIIALCDYTNKIKR